MASQLRHTIEAYIAVCLVAFVFLLIEMTALVLNTVTAGGESMVAILALERLLAGVRAQVQLQVGHASEFTSALMRQLLGAIILLYRGQLLLYWLLNLHYTANLRTIKNKRVTRSVDKSDEILLIALDKIPLLWCLINLANQIAAYSPNHFILIAFQLLIFSWHQSL